MALFKGFELEIISGDTVIANLGTCIFPALEWTANTSGSSWVDITSQTYAYFQPYTPDYASIGNTISDHTSDVLAKLLILAPLTLQKQTMQYVGHNYKVRLSGNASGYYAVSRSALSSLGTVSGTWDLYDNEDTLLGSVSSNIGFPLSNNVGIRCYLPHTIQDGAVSGQIASTLSISFQSSDPNKALVSVSTADPIPAAFITWYNALEQQKAPPEDPYAGLDGEEEISGGGTGVVGIPGFPGLTATSTGIIGLFAPTAAQMQALASYMWTDFGGQGTDVVSVLQEVVEAIKRAISNPLDYVIGLNIIPSQGLSIGAPQVIRFGFTSTNVSMPVLTNQYFAVDCGSIDFDPICGDTFLDYAPYSKFSIYLPYIGVKEVDANDFVGHTIGVIYHGDTVTGGVTAYILKDGSVMYQYSGCCALNVPLSSDNWGNTISGAVQIATSIVSGGLSGGAAGAVKAAALGASSVAANPSLLAPQVSHSGAVSGGAGCMAVQYPFVIREAVRFHSTEGFNTISGYPSYYYHSLSEVSGYTKVLDIHLHNMTATQEEIAEIENILKEGAIF